MPARVCSSIPAAFFAAALAALSVSTQPAAAAPDNMRGMALLGVYVLPSGDISGESAAGVKAVVRNGTGSYSVTFDRSVYPMCSYATAPLLPGSVGILSFSTSPGGDSFDTLGMFTQDSSGAAADLHFSVIVFCAR